MIFHTDSRTRVLVDVTLDIDPAGSTVELKVDDTWYPAEWQASPTTSGTKWKQTARTVGYFAGPTAPVEGATVLPLGRHPTRTRVSKTGDVLVNDSSPIVVR